MRIDIAQNHRSVHLLDPAVREVDVVGPGGHRAVPLLVSTKVRAGVVVGDGVGVCVHLATSRSEEIRCQIFEKIVDLKEYKNRARCMCTVYSVHLAQIRLEAANQSRGGGERGERKKEVQKIEIGKK